MNKREILTDDLVVPELIELYNEGVIDNISELYNLNKETYLNVYPALNDLDQKLIPIYISYFALTNYYLEEKERDFTNYISSLKNKNALASLFDEIMKEFAYLLMEFNLDESLYKISYDEYRETFKNKLVKDPNVIKFMNELYNDKCINAVRGYILSTGGLSVEKLGLDLSSEELIDLGVYIFYSTLYSCYKKLCNNIFEKQEFKKRIKKLDPTALYDLASTYFEAFDENLYSYEEYSDYLTLRKRFALEVFVLSEDQYGKYKDIARKK